MSRLLPMLSLLLLSPLCQAQMYKWVDAGGHVHYSDTKVDAGRASVDEMRIAPPPDPAAVERETAILKQREEDFKRRLRAEPPRARNAPLPRQPVQWNPNTAGKPGSDAEQCALARAILGGQAHHRSGAPVDAYDREVAGNDVQRTCH